MPKNPSLTRNRPAIQPETEREKEIAEKGYDRPIPERDDKKIRDLSVPLNEFYHKRFDAIATAVQEQIGVRVSRRQLAAKALREAIDKLAEQYGVD